MTKSSAAFVPALAFAVLVGTISDQTTGQPMPGIQVSVGSAHTTSHADGGYRLGGLTPGPASVTVTSDDVPPQRFTVKIGSSMTRANLRVCSVTLDYHC